MFVLKIKELSLNALSVRSFPSCLSYKPFYSLRASIGYILYVSRKPFACTNVQATDFGDRFAVSVGFKTK